MTVWVHRRPLLAGAILAAALALPPGAGAADRQALVIGTGGQTGVYYEVGQAICGLLNRDESFAGTRCAAPATGGSTANLTAVGSGRMAFALAQSDTQHDAVQGRPPFAEQGPMASLRSVFSLYTEAVTVVARDDSGIAALADLKGKRVNIGNAGSGQRATFELLMGALGWSAGDFAELGEWKAAEQAQAMCDGKVDAIVYIVGHPNSAIAEATTACSAHLVPVEGAAVERFVADNPYYASTTIPAGTYQGTPGAVPTFGVVATLVTSSAIDSDRVYGLVRAVFTNLDRLRAMHPALAELEPRQMAALGLSAPLHPGAERYYVEQGWR